MANLYTQAESNVRKTWIYIFLFLLLIIGVGWIISHLLEMAAILWIAVVLAILLNIFAYWYSDKIVIKLMRAKPIEKRDNPELYRLVENLSIAAGLPMPKICIMNERQPNAFATGRDPKHGVIAVTTGLLEQLERVELEGVIAHELAHIGNRDILLSTIMVVFVGIIIIATDIAFRQAFWRGGGRGGCPRSRLIMIAIALALAIIAPIIANLMKNAISRKREYLADASGALLTRYPEGLAMALEKISRDSTPITATSKANDATAHLFISNPFKTKERGRWLHRLFNTHPPIEDRISKLRGMNI